MGYYNPLRSLAHPPPWNFPVAAGASKPLPAAPGHPHLAPDLVGPAQRSCAAWWGSDGGWVRGFQDESPTFAVGDSTSAYFYDPVFEHEMPHIIPYLGTGTPRKYRMAGWSTCGLELDWLLPQLECVRSAPWPNWASNTSNQSQLLNQGPISLDCCESPGSASARNVPFLPQKGCAAALDSQGCSGHFVHGTSQLCILGSPVEGVAAGFWALRMSSFSETKDGLSSSWQLEIYSVNVSI